jgi:hypothetical protein
MPSEIKARPTLYRGIQMRSRLEADYAAHLDVKHPGNWEYEPECFAGPAGQWLPDFRVNGTVLQEVKPASLLKRRNDEGDPGLTDRVDLILKQMTVAWESDPGVILELVFWTYKAQEPDLSVIGVPGVPWQTVTGGLLLLMWPGMGQLAREYVRLNPGSAPKGATASAF